MKRHAITMIFVVTVCLLLGCSGVEVDGRVDVNIEHVGKLTIPDGINDFTKVDNVTFAPFGRHIGRLLFMVDKDNFYMLSFTTDVNRTELKPFILFAREDGENKGFWYYKDRFHPTKVSRNKASKILYDFLTKHRKRNV